jgi:phosphatidylinositol alpha-1,6-mannosyltransferase
MATLIITEDYPFYPGGISTYCYFLAKNLSHLGEEVLVLAALRNADLDFDNKQNHKIIRIRYCDNRWLRLFCRIWHTFRVIKKNKIEKIYATKWFPCGFTAALAGMFFKVPFFLVTHGTDITAPLSHPIRRFLRIMVLKKATGIFSCSEFTRNRVLAFGVAEKRAAYIPYGVDTERFYPNEDFSGVIRRKYGLENKKILLTVARIAWHKGHEMVIRSLPEILKVFPEAFYLIVGGDHGGKKNLEKIIQELKLEKYVLFSGDVPFSSPELPMFYNACDIFIMVSRVIGDFKDVEGFGIVYAEAAACGKPLIGAKSGGIGSAVIDNVTGILVDPLSLDDIVQAVIRLLQDRDFAGYLGKNARARAIEELSWAKLIERTKKFADDLLLS